MHSTDVRFWSDMWTRALFGLCVGLWVIIALRIAGCIHIYIYTYMCIYCIHIHIYIYTCVYIYISCVYIYINIHICIHICISYICIHRFIHVYICIMCIYMCVYIYIYSFIHIFTYIHTYKADNYRCGVSPHSHAEHILNHAHFFERNIHTRNTQWRGFFSFFHTRHINSRTHIHRREITLSYTFTQTHFIEREMYLHTHSHKTPSQRETYTFINS